MQAYTGLAPVPTIRQVVNTLLRESGPLGLVRGWNVIASMCFVRVYMCIINLLGGCIPAHIALFSVYERMKDRLTVNGVLASYNAAICGITATAAHDCILTPMDVIKQRLQLGCYKGAID